MSYSKVEIGQKGELLAQGFLKDKGYTVLESNFRKRYGEIDIIALKDNIVAFIEVRTKTSKVFGTAEESITHKKISKIRKVAKGYVSISKLSYNYRFDVITVYIEGNKVYKIEHYENAF